MTIAVWDPRPKRQAQASSGFRMTTVVDIIYIYMVDVE
jgi:hypothetical protein